VLRAPKIVCELSDRSAVSFFAGSGISAPTRFNIGSSRWCRIGVADVLEVDGQTLSDAVEDEDVIDAAVRGPNDVAAFGVEISTQGGVADEVFARDLDVEAIHDEVIVHVAALAGIAGR
jgi:hypothetical protein